MDSEEAQTKYTSRRKQGIDPVMSGERVMVGWKELNFEFSVLFFCFVDVVIRFVQGLRVGGEFVAVPMQCSAARLIGSANKGN